MTLKKEDIKHVDNFDIIETMLNFDIPNSFYFIQVLKRRKENPDMKSNARTINVYYLHKAEDLQILKERIVYDCEHNNARAYINLNRLDANTIALYTIKIIVEFILDGQLAAVQKAYTTACGNYHSDKKAKWVIDIDEVVDGVLDTKQIELSQKIVETIKELHSLNNKKNYEIIGTVPTKNGHHIITNPFDRKKFDKMFPSVTYHKNSPTILYV